MVTKEDQSVDLGNFVALQSNCKRDWLVTLCHLALPRLLSFLLLPRFPFSWCHKVYEIGSESLLLLYVYVICNSLDRTFGMAQNNVSLTNLEICKTQPLNHFLDVNY